MGSSDTIQEVSALPWTGFADAEAPACPLPRQVLKRRVRPYIPDFKLAFNHVCIHTGGRGVVEEIEKQLSMTPELMQPSKDTLFRYGNTSSSSIWCARPLDRWSFFSSVLGFKGCRVFRLTLDPHAQNLGLRACLSSQGCCSTLVGDLLRVVCAPASGQ